MNTVVNRDILKNDRFRFVFLIDTNNNGYIYICYMYESLYKFGEMSMKTQTRLTFYVNGSINSTVTRWQIENEKKKMSRSYNRYNKYNNNS